MKIHVLGALADIAQTNVHVHFVLCVIHDIVHVCYRYL